MSPRRCAEFSAIPENPPELLWRRAAMGREPILAAPPQTYGWLLRSFPSSRRGIVGQLLIPNNCGIHLGSGQTCSFRNSLISSAVRKSLYSNGLTNCYYHPVQLGVCSFCQAGDTAGDAENRRYLLYPARRALFSRLTCRQFNGVTLRYGRHKRSQTDAQDCIHYGAPSR